MGRALIVDDNAANRRLLEAFCQAFGLSVDCARSGRQALDLVFGRGTGGAVEAEAEAAAGRDFPYGIVLMDIHMPEMDGVETARKIFAASERAVPIVAVTADTTPENRARCIDAGIAEVVHKPVSVQVLAPILCRYFEF
jgi:CheY-like chemotaxis protein